LQDLLPQNSSDLICVQNCCFTAELFSVAYNCHAFSTVFAQLIYHQVLMSQKYFKEHLPSLDTFVCFV